MSDRPAVPPDRNRVEREMLRVSSFELVPEGRAHYGHAACASWPAQYLTRLEAFHHLSISRHLAEKIRGTVLPLGTPIDGSWLSIHLFENWLVLDLGKIGMVIFFFFFESLFYTKIVTLNKMSKNSWEFVRVRLVGWNVDIGYFRVGRGKRNGT